MSLSKKTSSFFNQLNFPLEEKNLASEIFLKKTNLSIEKDINNIIEEKLQMNLGEKTECLIYLKRGYLYLLKCYLTMNMHLRVTTKFSNNIYLAPNTKAIISDCEIKGGNLFKTIGLLCNQATVSINNCKFFQHKLSGIQLILNKKNLTSISFCNFQNNTCGVNVIGESNKAELMESKLYNNVLGIKVSLGSSILISNNHISNNKYGILIVTADPVIKNNSICFNENHGIYSYTSDNLESRPMIEGNSIAHNQKYAIKVKGKKNISFISKNEIKFNKKGGICIKKLSYVKILSNIISKNIGIGVLVMREASAHLERNKISNNVKSNICLCDIGDEYETTIFNNKIIKSRCNGIFMFNCVNFHILYKLI